MTDDQKKAVMRVLLTADRGCPACVGSIFQEARKELGWGKAEVPLLEQVTTRKDDEYAFEALEES